MYTRHPPQSCLLETDFPSIDSIPVHKQSLNEKQRVEDGETEKPSVEPTPEPVKKTRRVGRPSKKVKIQETVTEII